MPLWQLGWPVMGRLMISESSTSRPVLLFSIARKPLERMRVRRMVTLGALMITLPVMSRASMTAPAWLIVRLPVGVSVVPAGTPVLAALGHSPLGVGVVPGVPALPARS